MAILEAHDLTKIIDTGTHRVEILRGVDFDVPAGQFVAIMGASGSGKSTLLGLLAGLDAPTAGRIVVDGTDITGLSEDHLAVVRGRKIGFVFQSYQLIPTLTAEENVLLPLTIAGKKPDQGWFEGLLKTVGLQDRRNHRPAELSGGQQQRVAIARALVSQPTVVFADEPTGNLDSTTSGEILELMRHSVDTYGQTTMMVTHDPRAAAIADRILFLADGLIVRDLPRSEPSAVIAAMDELSAD